MKSKFTLILLSIAAFFVSQQSYSQNPKNESLWKKLEQLSYKSQVNEIYERKTVPNQFEIVSLNLTTFSNITARKSVDTNNIIELPTTNGKFSKFIIKETSNFDEVLQAKFPNIKSYSAQGIDDPTAVAKISVGTDGFHAAIFSGKESTLYIDPYSKDNKQYIVYNGSSLNKMDSAFECGVQDSAKQTIGESNFKKSANDGKLRTYRLALVCSGEYAQFHINRQGVSSAASEASKKAAVLSAMNTSMTRVNGIFEKDLSVKMVIVAENEKIIFLDPETDNITDNNVTTALDEVQEICDTQIGNNNYDIGHIFVTDGGFPLGNGIAELESVCRTGAKAKGVSALGSPIGDPFDINVVAHEFGHQFGAYHTYNNNTCFRIASSSVEPGSGSTIMAYAGYCSPNVQENSDDYFHAISIAEMWDVVESTGSCAVETSTNNSAPTANAGSDYSIPKATPFILTGIATDADGLSSLTYNWEQQDKEKGFMPPSSTNSVGPMFRSLPSKTTPARYFPELATVIAGETSSTWEVVPEVARELNFSFLVRDNNAGGGRFARDDMRVSVVDAEAFLVSGPNTAVIWEAGSTQTITWSKGQTDASPINCTTVNIKLSTDGGLTFPIVLKSNTANDGAEEIVVPNNVTTAARIMVEATDNIFYNVNTSNFEINASSSTFIMSTTDSEKNVCNLTDDSAIFTFNFDFIAGFTETVTLSASGEPSGSNISFDSNSIDQDGSITMTVGNLKGLPPQDYVINVVGTSASITQNIYVTLGLKSSDFNEIILTSPANGASNINLTQELFWTADSNAQSYEVQVATDTNFSNIVSLGNVATNSYSTSNLNGLTTYFWRVKAKNDCGEGVFSNVFSFTTISPIYCSSTFTDETDGSEHITNVTFGDINNNSGNDTEDGYQDFTIFSTNVKRGDTQQVSVTFDTVGFQDNCLVFIDWNQDYVFDVDSEMYDLGTHYSNSGSSVGTKTFNISIPDDARFGNTRMRVVVEYTDGNSHGNGACDGDHTYEWGETEDYTVIVDNTASIVDVAFQEFSLYPNPNNGTFTLNFDLIKTDKVTLQLFDITGRLIEEKIYRNLNSNFSEKVSFSNASKGLYLLKIKNGSGN